MIENQNTNQDGRKWKNVVIVCLALTTVLFVILFSLAFSGVIKKGDNTKKFGKKVDPGTYQSNRIAFDENCESFKSDISVNENTSEPYVPTLLMFCAREAVWKFLEKNCTSLNHCSHPREMPQWKFFDEVMQIHAAYRRLMIIFQLLDQRYLGKMEYHIGGGTLLGFLRHDDIIPHDHDVDFYMTKETKQFIVEKLYELPKDLNVWIESIGDIPHYKVVDMNTCMPGFHNGGIEIDLFDMESLKAWNEHWGGENKVEWDWEKDAKPISKVNVRGYDWPIPANVGKEITGYYGSQKALTYVPFKRDGPLVGADANGPCKDAATDKFLKPVTKDAAGYFYRNN